MIFSSPIFLLFFATVFTIYWFALSAILKGKYLVQSRHLFLLVCSYVFYTYSVWQYGLLIALSTLIDYIAGITLDTYDDESKPNSKRLRKLALAVSLLMNLGILAYFKYADFFIDNFIDFLIRADIAQYTPYHRQTSLLNLILPVGISFFTFQSMSYTIDVYRRVITVERNFLRFALFISFFPQLVAGPIVTAREFLPQLYTIPKFDFDQMRMGLRYFAMGYFKKVVLADNMAPIIDQIYSQPEAWGPTAHWVGALAFWVQVYGDFSGYSDMAIGTAHLLGFTLVENFRLPYLSKSVTEHWQRWHMSLIRWNRDYVYIPLGGSQVSFWRHKWNIFLTMFLAGVWHGANWTFVIWGAIHGGLLVCESLWKTFNDKRIKTRLTDDVWQSRKEQRKVDYKTGRYFTKHVALILLQFIITSFITIFFGTMFRSNNIKDSLLIMERMLGLVSRSFEASLGFTSEVARLHLGNSLIHSVLLCVVIVILSHILGWYFFEKRKLRIKMPAWLEFSLLSIWILICVQFGNTGEQAFIYFQF